VKNEDSYEDDYQDDYTSTYRSNKIKAVAASKPVVPAKKEPLRSSDDYDDDDNDFGDTENLLAHT
jgi:hypothetical protein